MNIRNLSILFLCSAVPVLNACSSGNGQMEVTVVDRPDISQTNVNYVSDRAPLRPLNFIKLPVGDVQPEGWVRKYLELQRDGLTGHLGEISAWLEKEGNAWLSDGGDHGWEEVPYWLKGYGNLAYILNDEDMINETRVWIEGTMASVRPDGFFGPENIRDGKRELWAQMIMLWCLQSYYEYSGDERVIDLMRGYFKWQLTVPDGELAEKIHRNTADWTRSSSLPNWHNVNIAQCFREPAEYYMLTGDSTMLHASYNVHDLIRRTFGQVPGGMFGSDENARLGYIDPRQGVETCGIVEQMASDEIMLRMTGDPFWAEHCEEVAFNTYPAAVMPDFKALRYITSPNHVVSDSENHYPGIANAGPFLSMNPFSSRCCQHNHAFGWPYFAEHLILATPDNGVAAAMYSACRATVKVSDGHEVILHEETHYPFDGTVCFTLGTESEVSFPMYFRIPSWAENAVVTVNGKHAGKAVPGKYVKIDRLWKDGDKVMLEFPMSFRMHTWQTNKNSVSVYYGPLTLSLKIDEKYVQRNSAETAIWDSKWQKDADPSKWPTTEIYPDSPWNYALVLSGSGNPLAGIEVVRKEWPQDDFPFALESVPLEFKATGRRIPSWTTDDTGLCAVLPDEGVKTGPDEQVTLVPMGAARLRISAFPNVTD